MGLGFLVVFFCFGGGLLFGGVVVVGFFASLPIHIYKAIAACLLQSTTAYYKGCARMKLGSAASIKFAVGQFRKLFLLATSVYFVFRLPGTVSQKK